MQNNTFSTLFVGQNLIRLVTVDSTNDYLKNLASKSEPLPEGTVIMADHQSQGRGQQNGKWVVEPGKNLTFSIFFKPSFLPIEKQFLLNTAISVGVQTAMHKVLGDGVLIKWPNDIFYKNKKMGGILIENTLSHVGIKQSVIGIGLNVNQQDFDEELAEKATSIINILHQEYDLKILLADICNAIEAAYLRLKAKQYTQLKSLYTDSLYLFNTKAKYRSNGHYFNGTIVGVEETGILLLEIEGEIQRFNFKEIEFIHT